MSAKRLPVVYECIGTKHWLPCFVTSVNTLMMTSYFQSLASGQTELNLKLILLLSVYIRFRKELKWVAYWLMICQRSNTVFSHQVWFHTSKIVMAAILKSVSNRCLLTCLVRPMITLVLKSFSFLIFVLYYPFSD